MPPQGGRGRQVTNLSLQLCLKGTRSLARVPNSQKARNSTLSFTTQMGGVSQNRVPVLGGFKGGSPRGTSGGVRIQFSEPKIWRQTFQKQTPYSKYPAFCSVGIMSTYVDPLLKKVLVFTMDNRSVFPKKYQLNKKTGMWSRG